MRLFTVPFSFDFDLREQAVMDLEPDGPVFARLPLAEQLKRLAPYFRAQEARDVQRLRPYRAG